jgi:hypothetical protein
MNANSTKRRMLKGNAAAATLVASGTVKQSRLRGKAASGDHWCRDEGNDHEEVRNRPHRLLCGRRLHTGPRKRVTER